MNFKALVFLAMLLASILLISADVAPKDIKDEKTETDGLYESKYGGYYGGGPYGGYGGWRGGYGGGRGGYGGGRGGYGGGRGGYGGGGYGGGRGGYGGGRGGGWAAEQGDAHLDEPHF